MNKNRLSNFTLLLAVSAVLAACGGNGGGESASPVGGSTSVGVGAGTPTLVVGASSIVTTVPLPTYAPGSEELIAYNLLNNSRIGCGFGALAQDPALDVAAKGHANYLLSDTAAFHVQNPTSLAFTGQTVNDRFIAAGYGQRGTFNSSENVGIAVDKTSSGYGEKMGYQLLNAPYHLNSMMNGFRDVGTAIVVGRSQNDFPSIKRLVFTLGHKRDVGHQNLSSDEVKTFPCEGTVGTNIKLIGEEPNPVPGRDLSSAPIGMSIYVGVAKGNTVEIKTVNVVNAVTNTVEKIGGVTTRLTDPNGQGPDKYLESHQAVIFTDKPAATNSKYLVEMTGTNSGKQFTRKFSFTTGSGGDR